MLMWFKENLSALKASEGRELFAWANEHAEQKEIEIDGKLEIIKFELDQYNDFRDKVLAALNSEKLSLPDWLMELNALCVETKRARGVDKTILAMKAFETRIGEFYKLHRASENGIRF